MKGRGWVGGGGGRRVISCIWTVGRVACASARSCQLQRFIVTEYLMYYGGPGFLTAPPFPPSKLDRRHTGRLRKRDSLLTGEGEEEREGAKSYDSEKAYPSIIHLIHSGHGVWKEK
jgi:hypothetical protein